MISTQAIFFDIGDTLVFDDPPLIKRLEAAAESAGLPLDHARMTAAFRATEAFAVRRYVGGIAWDGPDSLRETVSFFWDAMGFSVLTDSQWALFVLAFAAEPVTRYAHPDAKALLEELKQRGFILGAISDWEETLPEVLTELGLFSCFDALAISARVGVTKPDPRLFEDARKQVNLIPQECLHVGDWLELDVAGARAAGMQALLFDWAERHPAADGPRVTSWDQLRAYLLALPAPPRPAESSRGHGR